MRARCASDAPDFLHPELLELLLCDLAQGRAVDHILRKGLLQLTEPDLVEPRADLLGGAHAHVELGLGAGRVDAHLIGRRERGGAER